MSILKEAPYRPVATLDAEALIEEARQRHRRRQRFVSIAAAIVVLVGLLVAKVAGGGGSHDNPRPLSSDRARPPKAIPASPLPAAVTVSTAPLVPGDSVEGSADASIGYAIGWGGLHLTYNGGLTWIKEPMPANTPGNSGYAPQLAAFGTDDLWMTMEELHVPSINSATDYGSDLAMAIDHSTDGGATWNLTYVPCSEICSENGMSFVSPSEGFITGSVDGQSNVLYGTADGGASWSLISSTPVMTDLDFVTPDIGWSVSQSYSSVNTAAPPVSLQLYRTLDGGRTWTTVKISKPARYAKAKETFGTPHFFSSQVGVVSVEFDAYNSSHSDAPIVVIYTTTDGGKTWKANFTPTDPRTLTRSDSADGSQTLSVYASVPNQHTWVLASGSKLYSTSNAGGSWTTTSLPPDSGLPSFINFSSGTAGWITSLSVYRTVNGGKKWVVTTP